MSYFDRIGIVYDNILARVNAFYNALTTMNFIEDIAHRGYLFRSFYNYEDLANNTSIDVLFRTDANPVQLFIYLNATGEVDLDLYSGPTTSADGDAISKYNVNQDSATTSPVEIYSEPTVTDEGTQIDKSVSFGGTGNPQATRVGAVISPTIGWILEPNTDYLIRMTNRSGVTADGLLKLSFNCCVL